MPAHRIFSNPFFRAPLDAISPPRCLLCFGLGLPPACDDCKRKITKLPLGSCPRCAVGMAGTCTICKWMSHLDWLRSAADYEGVGGLMVRELKFSRAMELADPMGKMMNVCDAPIPNADALVPVPIHWSRRAQRGFNQSEELAAYVTQAPKRFDLLARRRATPPQARAKVGTRRSALSGAFVSKPCRGRRILLIDDVVTSGGTLEECALALKTAGAAWVGALTFARELPRSLSSR